jgi:hypothetical protein
MNTNSKLTARDICWSLMITNLQTPQPIDEIAVHWARELIALQGIVVGGSSHVAKIGTQPIGGSICPA